MSVNVLIIPEDFRKDQCVLEPIVEKMMGAIGVGARVKVCQDPLLGGIDQALNSQRVAEVIDRYRGMVRVFLLIVDRDGRPARRARLDRIETQATEVLDQTDRVLLAENAWQEVEVWVRAGLKDLPKPWSWADVRAERDPKERYYDVHARSRGLKDAPYGGRDVLAKEAAANYTRIRQLCPEDVKVLETRVGAALGA